MISFDQEFVVGFACPLKVNVTNTSEAIIVVKISQRTEKSYQFKCWIDMWKKTVWNRSTSLDRVRLLSFIVLSSLPLTVHAAPLSTDL